MTLFTYDNTVPAANDDPADDQPVMLSNTEQSALIWEEDHVGFNAADGGRHNKVTFLAQLADPGSAAGQCREYAKTTSSVTMPYYQRDGQPTVFPASPIKCAGKVANGVGLLDSWNVASITTSNPTPTTYRLDVTMSEAMRTTNYIVQVTQSGTVATSNQLVISAFPLSTLIFRIDISITSGNFAALGINFMALES